MESTYAGKDIVIKERILCDQYYSTELFFSGITEYLLKIKNSLKYYFFPKWTIFANDINFNFMKSKLNLFISTDQDFLEKLESTWFPKESKKIKVEGKKLFPNKGNLKIDLSLFFSYKKELDTKNKFKSFIKYLGIRNLTSDEKEHLWNTFQQLIKSKKPIPSPKSNRRKSYFLESLKILTSRIIILKNYSEDYIFDINLLNAVKQKIGKHTFLLFTNVNIKQIAVADHIVLFKNKTNLFSGAPTELNKTIFPNYINTTIIQIKGLNISHELLTAMKSFDWIEELYFYTTNPINSGKIFINSNSNNIALNKLLKTLSDNNAQIKYVKIKTLDYKDCLNILLKGQKYNE